MFRHFASNALTLLVILLFFGAGMIAWARAQYVAEGPLENAYCLRVGGDVSNMRRVTEVLAEEGAISSAFLFRAGAEYTDRGTADLKAGSFLIERGASMDDITAEITGSGRSTCGTEVNYRIGVLRNRIEVNELDPGSNRYVEVVSFDPAVDEVPPQYQEVRQDADVRFRLTMAEGATSWQIVEALKAADFLDGDIEEVPPEGSLAPLGEDVAVGTDRNALIAMMSERQAEILDAAWQNRDEDLPFDTKEEALILASIVEKETALAEERPLVASVFVNRLRQGIRLQTDPTVIYGVTRGQGALGRGLRQSELRSETPWNTYVIDGLPPTPIANPGRAAIEATLNPAESEFIYFVADGSGGHAFAKTLQEHNQNVARWREIEAERAAEEAAAQDGG